MLRLIIKLCLYVGEALNKRFPEKLHVRRDDYDMLKTLINAQGEEIANIKTYATIHDTELRESLVAMGLRLKEIEERLVKLQLYVGFAANDRSRSSIQPNRPI